MPACRGRCTARPAGRRRRRRPARRQLQGVGAYDVDMRRRRGARGCSRSSPARASSTSTAVIAAPASSAASWLVLAPGAAHRSSTAAPARSPPPAATIPAIWEPRDCGVDQPLAKGPRALQRRAFVSRPSGSPSTPRVVEPPAASTSVAAGRLRAAGWRAGSARERRWRPRAARGAVASPSSSRSSFTSHAGYESPTAQARAPSPSPAPRASRARRRRRGGARRSRTRPRGCSCAGQRDGVVDRRVSGHPVQEQQLERGQPERVAHVRVGGPERRLGVGAEHGVERAAPLDRAVDELVGEAAVGGARGARARAAPPWSRRDASRSRADGAGPRTPRPGRGSPGRPAAPPPVRRRSRRQQPRPAPRRNSAAVIRVRPSCCSSRTSSQPSPAAIDQAVRDPSPVRARRRPRRARCASACRRVR